MNYVVLYVDLEFIVGAVCTDNGNSFPITNGNDELLYLYFYNDPHSNKITFGRSNRDNAKKEINNYYGKFFDIAIDGHTKFKKGEFQKDAIELLQYSDLLKTIKDKYADVTKEKSEVISTLIVFSLSISDLAKQKTVEYLKARGFQIDSYTIPIAELAGYYPFSKKSFLPANGSTIILLTATNSALYIMKLVYSDNYFILDGDVKKYEGMGIDPRKRALVGYVINQININVGALSQNEISAEIEKKEFKADEWLKKIDAKAKNDNSPICITDSLSLMPSSIRQVLVKKSDIETFTNDFVNLLMDYYNAYRNDYINSDVEGIFLLGDCFNNSLVRQRFNNLFRDDEERKKKLFVYTNKDIQNILSVYPKIDFKRYINEEERSKAKAEAEERKIAEKRAFDNAKEVEAKAEQARIDIEKKKEEIRKEAAKLYVRATELDKEGKLQDALSNVENAIELDQENTLYKDFLNKLKDIQRELKIRQDQYISLIKKADKHFEKGEFETSLNVYEIAKEIYDNEDVRNKINETKENLEKKRLKQELIINLLATAERLFDQEKLLDAKEEFKKIIQIDSNHIEAKERIKEINSYLYKIEIQFNTYITLADSNFENKLFDAAINTYNEALKIKPNNEYCLKQISVVKEKKKLLTPPAPPPPTNNLKSSTTPANAPAVPPVHTSSLPTIQPSVPLYNGGKAIPPPPPIITKNEKNINKTLPLSDQRSISGKSVPPPPPPLPKKKL